MNNRQVFRFSLVILSALAIAGLITFGQVTNNNSTSQSTAMEINGPFAVVDHTGKSFTNKDLLGHYTLAYFGFTFCPAICPTELQKINLVMKKLGDQSTKAQPVFITVDPDRDTQKVMANYVMQFNPRLIGLTGTQTQIDGIIKAFHVYARKVEDPKMSDYTMDHSSYIYLINPDGNVASFYGPDNTAALIAESVKTFISH